MQILTIKAKPKMIFGVILALTGIFVILLTFLSNHSGKMVDAQTEIRCESEEERAAYLTSLGWEFTAAPQQKEIHIPVSFNQVYTNYNAIQKEQGFDLEPYQGRAAVIYTYPITNYGNNQRVIADLIVCDGTLIGADLCDPSASEGFLTALGENKTNGKTG